MPSRWTRQGLALVAAGRFGQKWISVFCAAAMMAAIMPLSGCTLPPQFASGNDLAATPPVMERIDPELSGLPWHNSVSTTPPASLTGPLNASSDLRQLPAPHEMPDLPVQPVVRETVSARTADIARPTVLHVSTSTFDQHVLGSEVPVLVDFYADWCGPCKALAPTLEQVAAENPQARVVKVNIDDSPELAARYGVKSVPRLLVFKDGQIAARKNGVASKAALNALLAAQP